MRGGALLGPFPRFSRGGVLAGEDITAGRSLKTIQAVKSESKHIVYILPLLVQLTCWFWIL